MSEPFLDSEFQDNYEDRIADLKQQVARLRREQFAALEAVAQLCTAEQINTITKAILDARDDVNASTGAINGREVKSYAFHIRHGITMNKKDFAAIRRCNEQDLAYLETRGIHRVEPEETTREGEKNEGV